MKDTAINCGDNTFNCGEEPDVTATGVNESELGRIESALSQLAARLDPEQAASELELREKYIGAERRLFMTRLERGKILTGYKVLYRPIRKWSEFLRIVNMPRQTAYDLLGANEAETASENDCTKSVQSRSKKSCESFKYGFDIAVDKIVAFANRTIGKLPVAQQQLALDAAMDRLSVGRKPIHITENIIEAQPGSYQITACGTVASEESTEVAA
jgi:hypothetical protein